MEKLVLMVYEVGTSGVVDAGDKVVCIIVW